MTPQEYQLFERIAKSLESIDSRMEGVEKELKELNQGVLIFKSNF